MRRISILIIFLLAGIIIMSTDRQCKAQTVTVKTEAENPEHLTPSPEFYDEAISVFRQYLAIDTTNPPGGEMKAALFLKKLLDKEGIENRIIDLGNNRANLYAVVRGNGSQKPVILLHHMDVVPADSKFWKHPPFGGIIDKGAIYGRGAVDMKAKGSIDLMTIIFIKRNPIRLNRDIILLAVSDEEGASTGSRAMVTGHQELIRDAEYLLDEGGSVTCDEKGYITTATISIGEKTPLWLTLTFTGEPGHGSVPYPDSSVNKAVKAATRIIDRKPDFVVLPEITDMIESITNTATLRKMKGWKGNLPDSLKNPLFLEQLSLAPELNACISNTISITMLKGSNKINTIPNETSISLDCRLIPGTDRDKFIENIKKISGDPDVKVTIEEYFPTFYSPADSQMITAIRKCVKRKAPGIKAVPVLLLSSTDSSFYRTLGIKCYGFEPYKTTKSEYNSAHSNDERIGVENFKTGIPMLLDILQEVSR